MREYRESIERVQREYRESIERVQREYRESIRREYRESIIRYGKMACGMWGDLCVFGAWGGLVSVCV